MTARRALLDGLARDAGLFEVLSGLAPLHPRNDTFPGEVFLHLAADALEWCGASRAEPLSLEGLRDRFLPEATFRGRQNARLQYALLAAAAIHGGTEPDLLDEVASWQADDFWQYALYAAVACIRAAASRADVPVRQVCQDLVERPGHAPDRRFRAAWQHAGSRRISVPTVLLCTSYRRARQPSSRGLWCRLGQAAHYAQHPVHCLAVFVVNGNAGRRYVHSFKHGGHERGRAPLIVQVQLEVSHERGHGSRAQAMQGNGCQGRRGE
jgi:hypothetical protein